MHNQLSGSELTKEPFRWDQRMFCLILQIPGFTSELSDKPLQYQLNPEDAPITAMCDVTGGRWSDQDKVIRLSSVSVCYRVELEVYFCVG